MPGKVGPSVDALDVLLWNCHKGNRGPVVAAFLSQQLTPARPDLIVLNEAKGQHATLRGWATENGYTLYQERPLPEIDGKPYPEQGDVALLVTRRRIDLDVLRSRVVTMTVPWKVFSHNQPHRPKRPQRVRLLVGDDWEVKVTAAHWPTNGFKGGNRVAFAESATRAALALGARRPGTAALDIGDHNEDVQTLRSWARTFGGTVQGHGPDSIIGTGCVIAEPRVLGKHGSDHEALRTTVTRTNNRQEKP